MKIKLPKNKRTISLCLLFFLCFGVFTNDVFSAFQAGEISGEVEKIIYQPFVNDTLRESKIENLDINKSAGAFILSNEKNKIAVSRWISPKRTRSYPYERVYDTLAFTTGKKAAVIPVLKDEGLGGERDFLQWDTISLLSLLDVHVVLAYYNDATKNTKRADQITAQKLDNEYITTKLKEVFEFKGTARQWNEKEANELKSVFEQAKLAYRGISKRTKTYLHDEAALDEIIKYAETPQKFVEFSRLKAQKAQRRETQTKQPKEALATDTKENITITNTLFGKYFFTVDETRREPQTVHLVEAKHSERSRLTNESDIKDALIKIMIYTNLRNVRVGGKPRDFRVVLKLTSSKLNNSLNSNARDEELSKYCSDNLIDSVRKEFLRKLFIEARENKFTVIVEKAETKK